MVSLLIISKLSFVIKVSILYAGLGIGSLWIVHLTDAWIYVTESYVKNSVLDD